MLILKNCLAVAALASIATAFVPWIPDYRCAEFNTCPSKRRALEVENHSRDLSDVELVQRIPDSTVPHDVQVERLAARLAHKYQRGIATTSSASKVDPLGKRENNYKIVTAAIPTTTNSVGIDQDGTDFSYFAKVKLGSKGTVMNMLLDTGAGTSWVMGHDCESAPCKSHNNFGAQDSDTFKETGVDFELHYGSGNVSGHMATDTFSIAGFSLKPTFGVALVASDDFNNFPIDGILGLAQSKGPHDTFIETLVASKILGANMFGVSISRSSDGPNTGVLNFGAPDASRFTGSLSYVNLHVEKEKEGDWAIPMDEVSFDGKKAGIQYHIAYVDTGTSYIFTKPEEVKKLHDTIPGATSEDGVTWRVPCTTTADLQFKFGPNTYSVAARDWVGPEVNGKCTSNIYGHDVVGDAWLLGDTFLKNVYAVFDIDGNRIGFAPRPAPPLPSSSTSISTGGPTSSLPGVPSVTGGPIQAGSSGSEVSSNVLPTGPLTTQTSDPAATAPEATSPPGMGGHQTSSGTVAEAIQSSASPSSSTVQNQSAAGRLETSLVSTFLAILSLCALVS